MAIPESIRQTVRHSAGFACEYCGVTETQVGGELTIDHYVPQSQGGTDDLDNLVYCCARFNSYKGDYWRQTGDLKQLWHPRQEPAALHYRLLENGEWQALTERGRLALRVLRLNRPQLVRKRQISQQRQRLLARVMEITDLLTQLNERQGALDESGYNLFSEHKELLRQLADLEDLR
jgi:hypothetical protein